MGKLGDRDGKHAELSNNTCVYVLHMHALWSPLVNYSFWVWWPSQEHRADGPSSSTQCTKSTSQVEVAVAQESTRKGSCQVNTWIKYFARKLTVLTQHFGDNRCFFFKVNSASLTVLSPLSVFPAAHRLLWCDLILIDIDWYCWAANGSCSRCSHIGRAQRITPNARLSCLTSSEISHSGLILMKLGGVMHLCTQIWRLKNYIDWPDGDTVFKGHSGKSCYGAYNSYIISPITAWGLEYTISFNLGYHIFFLCWYETILLYVMGYWLIDMFLKTKRTTVYYLNDGWMEEWMEHCAWQQNFPPTSQSFTFAWATFSACTKIFIFFPPKVISTILTTLKRR